MTTLYISDLDGTLLTSSKEVAPYTAAVLTEAYDRGYLIGVASARMPYTVNHRFTDIPLRLPGILLNGALLWDFEAAKAMEWMDIEASDARATGDVLSASLLPVFMFTMSSGRLAGYYLKDSDKSSSQYYNELAIAAMDEFAIADSFGSVIGSGREALYFATTGSEEAISLLDHEVSSIVGVQSIPYLNVYTGQWCLEVASKRAGKASFLEWMKSEYDADEVVAFGDNHNDISLMKAADRCYAPANSAEAVKAIADRVIPSADDEGVAQFLAEELDIRDVGP